MQILTIGLKQIKNYFQFNNTGTKSPLNNVRIIPKSSLMTILIALYNNDLSLGRVAGSRTWGNSNKCFRRHNGQNVLTKESLWWKFFLISDICMLWTWFYKGLVNILRPKLKIIFVKLLLLFWYLDLFLL